MLYCNPNLLCLPRPSIGLPSWSSLSLIRYGFPNLSLISGQDSSLTSLDGNGTPAIPDRKSPRS